jgi:hypothetical protein
MKLQLTAALVGLAIATSALGGGVAHTAILEPTAAGAMHSSTSANAPAPGMNLGKAVKMTPTELAKQQAAVRPAVPGPATGAKAGLASPNWSGQVAGGTYQGVAGKWIVPAVQATTANKYSCTWIGLGGWSNGSLIQTGTESDSVNGHTRYYAWLEMLPAAQSIIRYSNGTAVPVAPGDVMWAYIYKTATPNRWAIYLQDQTRGWALSTTSTYSTPGPTVEWVHEATQVGGVVAAPPAFSKVTFTTLEVEISGKWYYTSMTARNELFMVQHGVTYAAPSAPTNTAPQQFSIAYG